MRWDCTRKGCWSGRTQSRRREEACHEASIPAPAKEMPRADSGKRTRPQSGHAEIPQIVFPFHNHSTPSLIQMFSPSPFSPPLPPGAEPQTPTHPPLHPTRSETHKHSQTAIPGPQTHSPPPAQSASATSIAQRSRSRRRSSQPLRGSGRCRGGLEMLVSISF